MNIDPIQSAGFTLIELMITVAIVGILAAIAYPSYAEYVLRGNRAEGIALLNDAAARQERYFAQNNTYADTLAKLGYASATSVQGRYNLAFEGLVNATVYKFTTTPTTTDAKCAVLKLNQAGVREETGTSDVTYCWK